MEQTFLNVPKMFVELIEKSDQKIRENAKAPQREKDWFELIKEMAQKIADGGLILGKPNSMGESPNDDTVFLVSNIPSCSTFVEGQAETHCPRVSSFFPLKERDHLHGKKRHGNETSSAHMNGKKVFTSKIEKRSDSSVSAESSQSASRTASTKNELISKIVENDSDEPMMVEEAQPASEMHFTSDETFVKPDSTDKFVTPVRKRKVTPLNLNSKQKLSRSSRKSKITSLEQEIFQKKLRMISTHSNEPHLATRSSRFSMGKKKYSGLREINKSTAGAHYSSKTSVTGKKETLQCKEDAAAENLKKLKDARRKKIEENKRIRDEKMERTKEKRMKLEKTKALSSKQKTTEAVMRTTRAQEKNAERNTRSREVKEKSASESISKTSQANSKKKTPSASKKPTPPSKTPLTKGTPASSKGRRLTPPLKTPALSKVRRPTPPLKTPASSKVGRPTSPLKTSASPKGRRPTPPLKSQPLKLTPNPTVVMLQNTTITVEKETENKDSLKKTPLTSPPAVKAILKLNGDLSSSGKKSVELLLPGSSEKSSIQQTASTPKSMPSSKKTSYELTPDHSSPTSYDMSEIVSDDEDETSSTQKPIPSWAVGLRLRNALIHQHYNPVDTEELFGTVSDPPDLEQMFNVQKKAYNKRTSSAIWQSPRAFT